MPRKMVENAAVAEKPLRSKGLALAFQKAAAELGTNPRQIAIELDNAYDHIRRVYNGEDFPSKKLLGRMCEVLKLNYNEMLSTLEYDKAMDKNWIETITGEPPALSEARQLWPHLSKRDEADVLAFIKQKVSTNISGNRTRN